MKRIISFLIICLIVAAAYLNAGGIVSDGNTAFADGKYSTDYYRASSSTGNLSEAQRNELDKDCISFIDKYKIDMVLVAVDAKEKGISDIEHSADGYYEDCGFGYGKNKSGIMITYDVSENKVHYTFYGNTAELIPQKYVKFAAKSSVEMFDEYGEFGVLYSALAYMRDYFEEHGTEPQGKKDGGGIGGDSGKSKGDSSGNSAKSPGNNKMPDWYPEDVSKFEFFHDADAPRVVDVADIFTDSEEKEIAGLISRSSAESGKDIVVFTDVSTYGLERKIYAADFYDFNGYGFGEEREGVCLMICMDPDDRGWWTCCTGSDTMGLYTQDIANSIDDELYNYMVDGDYAAGVSDWIKNMKTLFVKGIPFIPEWYPDRGSDFVRTHDSSAPRVNDASGKLTETQLEELESRIGEMSKRFGYDIVIHISNSSYNMLSDEYADSFYVYNGYGFGENYDGIIAVLFTSSDTSRVMSYGSIADKTTEVNLSRLESQSERDDKYEAAVKFLDNLEHMEKTGRVPRSMGNWIFGLTAALIIGLIVALIDMAAAKAGMKTPRIAFDANNYIVKGSLFIRAISDRFLRSDITRTYDPIEDDDDDGGGDSPFSSSYSGSSGASHSGSGRSF